jgi:ferric-dicitrate binding protein FerR (iron transport regulator)
VSLPPDERIADLFVRYWDNALSAAESDELQRLLSDEPVARDVFRMLSMQVVAAAELPGVIGPAPAMARKWSRRRILQYVGGGAVAGLLATVVGRRFWPEVIDTPIRITALRGEVTVRTVDGILIPPDGFIPLDGIVSTIGPSASAVLSYPDGTDVALTGESVLKVTGNGRKLSLLRGTAAANILPQAADAVPLTLSTTETTLARLSGVVFTLGRATQSTEVGVQVGRVTVSDAAGEPLEIVHGGECLTVQTDGSRKKLPIPPTPEKYVLDLSKPLPDSWNVGVLVKTESGPIVRSVRWFDPYHKAEMFQIRSDHRWAQGFFKLKPKSTFALRYRVRTAGEGQMIACVRTERLGRSDTGVIEWNGRYELPGPDGWQTIKVRAEQMLDNKHTPKFGSPWVGFLLIFNSYKEDLGLEIASFEVTSPDA